MTITSIQTFSSAFELISELQADAISGLDDDLVFNLQHIDDYNGIVYGVINGDTVFALDDIFGTVYGEGESLDEFVKHTIEYAREDG